MSAAELFHAVSALPRSDKIHLMQFIVGELARDEGLNSDPPAFVPPPLDQCPYSVDELAAMRQETGGIPLAEVWQRLGRS